MVISFQTIPLSLNGAKQKVKNSVSKLTFSGTHDVPLLAAEKAAKEGFELNKKGQPLEAAEKFKEAALRYEGIRGEEENRVLMIHAARLANPNISFQRGGSVR